MKRLLPLLLLSAFAVSSVEATTPLTRIKVVEYIESSGTQCINTGVSPLNNNVRLEMTYRFVSLPAVGSRKYVFGSCQGSNNVRFQYAVGSEGKCAFGFGDQFPDTETVASYDTDTIHTIVCNNGVFTLDGTQVKDLSSATFAKPNATAPVYLFANNNKGSVSQNLIPSMRLFSCKIWANGVLVRDFVPALDGEMIPGLYDIVEGNFHYNAGSGRFSAGEVVREILLSYRTADYIEANQTAYIDTRYVPNADTELEMEFAFTRELSTKTYVFGVYGSNGGRFMFSYGPANEGCFVGYGNVFDRNVLGLPYNTERHIVKYVQTPSKGFYFDDIFVNNNTQTNLTTWTGTSANLFLGTCNRNGEDILTNLNSPIRIYSCKISENGTLKRDLVPKQRLLDGKNGLYDNVTRNFYAYYGDKTDFTAVFPPPGLVVIFY